MGSVMEKFDLLDFFNLIIAGAVFLIGLGFYDNDIQRHLIHFMTIGGKSNFSTILMITLIIALSYIVGLVFNALGFFILKNRYHDKLVGECLKNPSVVGNTVKLDIYKKNANNFFQKNHISIKDNQFNSAQCSCFYAYCVYFIQTKAQDRKAEKLRDVQGLSKLLTISFSMLFFVATVFAQQCSSFILIMPTYVGILVWFLDEKSRTQAEEKSDCLCAILLVVLFAMIIAATWDDLTGRQQITMMTSVLFAYLFYLKFRIDVSNRVRLVLAVYDICKDTKDSRPQQLEINFREIP